MTDISIYDTTLRDGTQREGISLSADDKMKIARRLDEFGMHYIEGGWPGSNPKDAEFFQRVQELRFKTAKLAAFGSTLKKDSRPEDDVNIQTLLAADPAIADPTEPVSLPPGRGEVRFRDVTFGFAPGSAVLRGLDLAIPGGTSLAVVGATGAGKTTLAHLIPRFRDVERGAITLDGVDVRTIALDELRREVAVVFQETYLFSASVRDNIGFGDPDATDEQIRLAARLAQAHDFISDLPAGYDTIVGERGHSLSGGQRQRVALARAVLRDPRVLILDDATSSVDAIVEAEMLAALEQVMRGRTTIIVAHRTSTLALADQVVFLDGGRIVAMGTHAELLAAVPRYGEVLAQAEASR